MADLTGPRVTSLQFYTLRELQKPGKRLPYAAFEELAGNGLQVAISADSCRKAKWTTSNGELAQVDWTLAHDTHILRISLSRPGVQSFDIWSDLDNALEKLVSDVQSDPNQPIPWGATRIISVQIPKGGKTLGISEYINEIAMQHAGLNKDIIQEATPFGWCWSLGSQAIVIGNNQNLWQRWLIWVIPQERSERVETVFLQPLNQGLARIELYLHKSLHHSRQHEAVRAALENARIELQEGMLVTLRTVSFANVQQEEPELEKISHKLMIFLAEKTQTEVLLNSLRNNRQSFIEHLERVKLDTPAYESQAALIQRGIEQLESDLANAQAVAESSYTFQDIQRSIESNRLERAGVLLGGAAAILAGLAIFNNFLDIWNLSVEKSGLLLPEPWLRALLGALAAIFWPLGAYQFVKRKYWRGGISLFIGVLAIILAIVFTVLINA